MISNKKIIEKLIASNYSSNMPYMRPFLCNGNPCEAKVFLVGINPATPIYPNQINLEKYIDIINNYDEFMSLYINFRKNQGKANISRTRIGIKSFTKLLKEKFNITILETDIYSYPTKNVKELRSISVDLLEKSNNIFWNVLSIFPPKIVIIYGKLALETFINNANHRNIEAHFNNLQDKKIEEIEEEGSCGNIILNGNSIEVFACRHFMYYGKKGSSYKNFIEKLLLFLSNNN